MIIQTKEKQIYWANALFSEADRSYNRRLVGTLRHAGYSVFLPQETDINFATSPSSLDIFRTDTAAVMNSQLMVACFDQETIDSGVACEIGIAYCLGIPVIGLYTDIRQHRQGPGRMYKNPYILGAIESNGVIVNSFEDLLKVLPNFLSGQCWGNNNLERKEIVERHYESMAPTYSSFVKKMKGWYKTPWDPWSIVDNTVRTEQAKHILDIGCGPGELGSHIFNNHPNTYYYGYDSSPGMIAIGQRRYQNDRCLYSSDFQEVINYSLSTPFDMAIALFTLHDHFDKQETLSLLRKCIRPQGCILIIDLSIYDLPKLVNSLKCGLARPIFELDSRIDPVWLIQTASALNLILEKCELFLPIMCFPTLDNLDEYMNMFGIYSGMDLPLGLSPDEGGAWRERVKETIANFKFPFSDRRVFVECILRK